MKVNTIPMVAATQKKAAVQRQDNVQAHDHKAAPAKMNKQDLNNHKLNKLA